MENETPKDREDVLEMPRKTDDAVKRFAIEQEVGLAYFEGYHDAIQQILKTMSIMLVAILIVWRLYGQRRGD